MDMIKCRKCKKRLMDMDEKNDFLIYIKQPGATLMKIDLSSIIKNDLGKRIAIMRRKEKIFVYEPEKTLIEYQCPRCKRLFGIHLESGRMNEITN